MLKVKGLELTADSSRNPCGKVSESVFQAGKSEPEADRTGDENRKAMVKIRILPKKKRETPVFPCLFPPFCSPTVGATHPGAVIPLSSWPGVWHSQTHLELSSSARHFLLKSS